MIGYRVDNMQFIGNFVFGGSQQRALASTSTATSGASARAALRGVSTRTTRTMCARNRRLEAYTYSDFTGFGLRNFTAPAATR